ncbi:MAG: peptidylprolyl isomerase [Sandaracinaceae bacterium]
MALTRGLSLVALILALASGAAAQDGDPTPGDPPTDPTQTPERDTPTEEPSAEEVARRARVVASIGDVTLSLGDVEDAINEQSPFMRARYRDRAQLDQFVQSMIRFELLARAAERAEMGEDPVIRRVVNQNSVQQLIRREFDENLRPDTVALDDVRAYYESHPAEFSTEEMRRASHIQVETREEAERILEQVREADTRTFRTLARERSIDTETRLRGGDLRYFDESGRARNTRDPRVDEGLATAAFGLTDSGDVAGPVEVGENFSVIRLTGRRPAEHRTLTQAEPTIRLRLWRSQRQERMEDFVARLRREANVEAHYERLSSIELDDPTREDLEADGDNHGDMPSRPAPAAEESEEAEEPAAD